MKFSPLPDLLNTSFRTSQELTSYERGFWIHYEFGFWILDVRESKIPEECGYLISYECEFLILERVDSYIKSLLNSAIEC